MRTNLLSVIETLETSLVCTVLHLDPVFRPAGAIAPVAPFRHQAFQTHATSGADTATHAPWYEGVRRAVTEISENVRTGGLDIKERSATLLRTISGASVLMSLASSGQKGCA